MGRCVTLALLMSLRIMSAELKVDHVTAAAKDLHVMERALQSVRLPYEYSCPHANPSTEMALTSFPDGSYLELIGIQPQAHPSAVAPRPCHTCMQENSDPCPSPARRADLS